MILTKKVLYIILFFALAISSMPAFSLPLYQQEPTFNIKKKKKKKKEKKPKSKSKKSNKVEHSDSFVIDFDETNTVDISNKSNEEKSAEITVNVKSLGVNLPKNAYQPLIKELEKWLGTPYKYAGNSDKGIDCSGLVFHSYQNVYKLVTDRRSSGLFLQCDKIDEKNIRFGDLVFFKIGGSNINHVGIYLSENKFIHASTQKGVIVSQLEEAYYKKYFFAFGRLKMLKESNTEKH